MIKHYRIFSFFRIKFISVNNLNTYSRNNYPYLKARPADFSKALFGPAFSGMIMLTLGSGIS